MILHRSSKEVDMANYTYNNEAAAQYAANWYYRHNTNKYPNYSGDTGGGGDCANFASQCIHEGGGIPMKHTGGDTDRKDYRWYASPSSATQAWRGVGSLRRHISFGEIGQNFSHESLAAGGDAFKRLRPGDLVFKLVDNYNGNRNADVTHVGVVSRIEGQNIWTYEHSPNTHRIWPYTRAQTIMYRINSCEVTDGTNPGGGNYATWQEKYGNNTFVQSNSFSGNVERWQTDMNKWLRATKPSIPLLVADGKYGPKSIAACLEFQKWIPLSTAQQTGMAGPNDKPRLFQYCS